MEVLTVDLSPWAKKNMALSPEGDLQVRPGAHRVFDFGALDVVGGFSIFDQRTQSSWHYVFYLDGGVLYLRIYDENWGVIQRLEIPADRRPRDITHAVINEVGQLFISSPDFATLWGMVGGGVRVATKVTSATGLTSIEVPKGLVAAWANRIVVADGNLLYVSESVGIDNGDGRAFVPQNILTVDAPIIGLHAGQDDLLVIVTTDGVWGLPGEASSTEIIARSEGRLFRMQDYDGVTYRSTCEVRNKVYGLTRAGFRRLDVIDSPEIRISDPVVSSRQFSRVSYEDYRQFEMISGPDGPIITTEGLDQFLYTDIEEGFLSWWALSENHIQGILRRADGRALYLTGVHAHLMDGNFDADYDSTIEDDVVGTILVKSPVPPAASGVARRFFVHTDSHRQVSFACRHEAYTSSPPNQLDVLRIGVGDWDDVDVDMLEPAMQTVRCDMQVRTDDIALEVTIRGAGRRLGRAMNIHVKTDQRYTE